MKNFIDRLLPFADPHFKKGKGGATHHIPRYQKYPDLVVIANCGFPDPSCFTYYRSVFSFLESTEMFRLLAGIYCAGGPLLQVDSSNLARIRERYLALLKKAGAEIVKTRSISVETSGELEKPLILPDAYMEMTNRYWDTELTKIV